MDNAFTEIMAGLDDAIAHAKGEPTKVIEHKPLAIHGAKARDAGVRPKLTPAANPA